MTSDDTTDLLLSRLEGNPVALLNFARTFLLAKGREREAREVCERVLAASPHDPELAALARSVIGHGIGSWYFTMVQDVNRHALYERALKAALVKGGRVLDIGAGTGLFAMLAARCGADEVIACEQNPAIADAVRDTVAANGLSDRVKVVAKLSTDLQLGVDMQGPADVVIWDNLANNLIAQGATKAVDDAKRRLAVQAAPFIPSRAEIMLALAHDLKPENRQMMIVDGFDLSAFNRFAPSGYTKQQPSVALRSESRTIFDFDFQSGSYPPERGAVSLTASGGQVDGLIQWVRFHLGHGIVYDTLDETAHAFGLEFHGVTPIDTVPGQAIEAGGRHDGQSTWFWLERR